MYVLLIIAIYSDSCVEKTLIYYPHITKKCDICDMIQIETIFDILVKGFIIGRTPRSGGRIMHPEDFE
mgnify:CR=1 FL=1